MKSIQMSDREKAAARATRWAQLASNEEKEARGSAFRASAAVMGAVLEAMRGSAHVENARPVEEPFVAPVPYFVTQEGAPAHRSAKRGTLPANVRPAAPEGSAAGDLEAPFAEPMPPAFDRHAYEKAREHERGAKGR